MRHGWATIRRCWSPTCRCWSPDPQQGAGLTCTSDTKRPRFVLLCCRLLAAIARSKLRNGHPYLCTMTFQNNLAFAQQLDAADPLRNFRNRFHIPPAADGTDCIYLCGNSLGLQPKTTAAYIAQELDDWKTLGVEGHLQAKHPWLPYHEFLTNSMAAVVGALPHEVVVMNTLTANLHLMMVSFYRPVKERYKILIDWNPFPSDRYAIASQLRYHGFDETAGMVEPQPRPGSSIIETNDILATIEQQGHEIALVMIGGVNYYSGQFYDLDAITKAAHAQGCVVGFDLAHAAGNLPLYLHNTGCDFAVWCTYKYLNSGPGSLAGCFVHERHAHRALPRFEGWWGHNKQTRFKMGPVFEPIGGAESWQLSNPPVLSMAAIRASLDIFAEAGMERLRQKSVLLTGYLEWLLRQLPGNGVEIITPKDPAQRGCQLSLRVAQNGKQVHGKLMTAGIITDWREPDVIRVAPVPLYNSFEEMWRLGQVLENISKI
jgi:kynureninase